MNELSATLFKFLLLGTIPLTFLLITLYQLSNPKSLAYDVVLEWQQEGEQGWHTMDSTVEIEGPTMTAKKIGELRLFLKKEVEKVGGVKGVNITILNLIPLSED